jgi:hypothetical protein
MGWKCTKTFYFNFKLSLNTNIQTFNQNYLAFLQALTNSFQASSIDALTINSIIAGSVNVSAAASPSGDPGTT